MLVEGGNIVILEPEGRTVPVNRRLGNPLQVYGISNKEHINVTYRTIDPNDTSLSMYAFLQSMSCYRICVYLCNSTLVASAVQHLCPSLQLDALFNTYMNP